MTRKKITTRTKIAGAAVAVLAVAATASTVGIRAVKDPAPPPPVLATIGDSVAFRAGQFLPGENDAVGGTNVCDTALETNPVDGSPIPLPYANKLLIHVGGHTWANYDAATAQACLEYIVSRYGGTQVYIATSPLPGTDSVGLTTAAIYCGNGTTATNVLDENGIPHGDIINNADYELRQRIANFNTYKLSHSWPSNVHIVRWDGTVIEHNTWPDCIHQTDAGAQKTADIAEAAGFHA